MSIAGSNWRHNISLSIMVMTFILGYSSGKYTRSFR
jgi:hypothetical protein